MTLLRSGSTVLLAPHDSTWLAGLDLRAACSSSADCDAVWLICEALWRGLWRGLVCGLWSGSGLGQLLASCQLGAANQALV